MLWTLEEDEGGVEVEAIGVPSLSLVTAHCNSAGRSAGCGSGDTWTPVGMGANETLLLWLPPTDAPASCCLLSLLSLTCFSGDEGERESCD